MAISKIILNGTTQIDLTGDTVAASNLISPNTAHGADGEPVVGTATTGFVITDESNTSGTTAVITGGGGGGSTPSGTWELVGIGTAYVDTDGSFNINDLTQPLFSGEGELWKVTYDNTSYECETIALNTTTYYLGNVNIPSGTDDGTGLPFFICDYAWGVEGTFRDKPQTATSKSIRLDKYVSGGSTPSATAHEIYFEFSDGTDTTTDVYYNDSLISTMITAYAPATYGQKTVTLAELDGVAWYEPANIPLNTQLVDYTAVKHEYIIDGTTGEEVANSAGFASDYIVIDPIMTFAYIGYEWWDAAFYDSSKTYISGFRQDSYADSIGEYGHAYGTLTPARIPANAMYIRLTSYTEGQADSTTMSLIRTA